MTNETRANKESFPICSETVQTLWIVFTCLFSLNMMDKQRNHKQQGDNRSNLCSHGYMQTGMKTCGMWPLYQVELRRFDTSSQSLGKKAGALTM